MCSDSDNDLIMIMIMIYIYICFVQMHCARFKANKSTSDGNGG